jgi:serine/threonine protein phosphatase PrpC
MSPPERALRHSLVTPLEPASPRARPVPVPVKAQQATHSTVFRRIDVAAASSCGSQHDANEDAHSALPGSGDLFIVADGVGGGAMAQLASRALVQHLHRSLDGQAVDAGRVRQAMLDADRAVARRIAETTVSPGAATVALCAPANRFASSWLVAWVGDCRAYRLGLRGRQAIEPLTRDDTFRHLNELPPLGGTLDDPARMVGNGATAGANVALYALPRGDLLVLCSDGVHKHLDGDDWTRLLRQATPLAERCEALIALARVRGSVDDATVLLLQRAEFTIPRPRWMRGGDRRGISS